MFGIGYQENLPRPRPFFGQFLPARLHRGRHTRIWQQSHRRGKNYRKFGQRFKRRDQICPRFRALF